MATSAASRRRRRAASVGDRWYTSCHDDSDRIRWGILLNYHPDDFFRLLDLVEADGGALLEDRCESAAFQLTQPTISGAHVRRTFETVGCGEQSRFVLPYDRIAEAKLDADEAAFVTVCAVDDDMGKWPKYRAAMQVDD